jgi:hypothetical protein
MSLSEQIAAIHDAVEFAPKSHRYKVAGVALPGVTSIIGSTLGKGDGLTQWAVNLAKAGQDWREVSKAEAAIGTQVHSVVEDWALLRLGLPTEPPQLCSEAAYLASGLREWLDSSGIEPLAPPERRVYHPTLGYCGTVDMIATVDCNPTVVDVKTSKTAGVYYDSWDLQVAAYSAALYAHELPFEGAVLRIPKDGSAPALLIITGSKLGEAGRAWDHLLAVYNWQKDRK